MVLSPGNSFSVLVFFLWVPIAIWGAYRWPPAKAAALLVLLPMMFLPERVYFDFPGLPRIAKSEVATFWLLIGALLFHRQRLRTVRLGRWSVVILFVLLAGSTVSVLLNTAPLPRGSSQLLPGHRPYDAVTYAIEFVLNCVLPFVLAAAMFREAKDIRVLLKMLVGSTLVYAIFQLVEVRLSPQFNIWVYGFFQHTFLQMVRDGGFRPIVFMSHGLTVAIFTVMGVLAAASLRRLRVPVLRVNAIWAMLFLWVVLALNKSLASFLYTLIAVPLILLSSPKTQIRVAVFVAVFVLTYPMVRGADLIPLEGINDFVTEHIGGDRAESLMVRFTNEEQLLDRALERPFFGWGRYGRGFIYDPVDGLKSSISDGDWILTLGTWGIIGFLGKYLWLLSPIFGAARRTKYLPRLADRQLVSTLTLLVAVSAFDLLPNSNPYPLAFVLSGALFACPRAMARQALRRQRVWKGLQQQQAQGRRVAR